MKVQIFNDFNKELQVLWQNFEVNANLLVFQSYEWQKYWYEQIGHPEYDISICVTVVSFNNQVRAIFPLGIKKAYGARVLEFMGSDQADYSAPLIANDISAVEFTKIWIQVLEIIPPHDVVYFRNIPKSIQGVDNFLLQNIDAQKVGSSFSATLPNSVDSYFLTLSKRMLKDNKRMVRKLSKMGKLKFLVLNNDKDFNRILEITINQKSDRHAFTGSRNIFHNKSVKSFFNNIYILNSDGFNVHLSVLMLNDEILATHLGFWHKHRFYYLVPTFNQDDKWKKFSLGRIHLEKLIEWAINNKVSSFDFTIGAETYKNIWCNNEMNIYRHLKIRSFRGAFYYVFDLLLELVKANNFLKKKIIKILNFKHKIQNTNWRFWGR